MDPLKEAPEPLKSLKGPTNANPLSKKFKEQAHNYNTLLAFASTTYPHQDSGVHRQPPVCLINGKISHQLGDLITRPNGPMFMQMYTLDPEDVAPARAKVVDEGHYGNVDKDLLTELDEMLRTHNPIAKDVKTAYKYFDELSSAAQAQGKEPPRFQMTIPNRRDVPCNVVDPNIHPHRVTADPLEVSAVWHSEDPNEGPPDVKGTRLQMHGDLKTLAYLDPNRDALCNPILFPLGQQIFRTDIKLENTQHEIIEEPEPEENVAVVDRERFRKRKGPHLTASRRQIARALLSIRPSKDEPLDPRCEHPIWGTRKLAQRYVLDTEWAIEREEAEFIKKNVQQNLRYELPEALIEAHKKQLKPGQTLGNVYKLPVTWKGGQRHMQEAYTKAMALFRRFGKPTFMVTFTGNGSWEECKKGLYADGQMQADRPDIICRVFEDKAREIHRDLEEKAVLGKCKVHVECREWQKKGTPHFHKLLTIEPPVGVDVNSSEFIDSYISAEIPELPPANDHSPKAEQQIRLYELVTKLHIHSCSTDSVCRKSGRCSKGFPKSFQEHTVASDMKPTDYRRRRPKENGWGSFVKGGREFDNRYVVPYNPWLLLKFGCHINVEKIYGLGAGKYALKYLTKGHEIAYVKVTEKRRKEYPHNRQHQQGEVVDYDEFEKIFQTHYMSPQEAYTRLSSIPLIRMSHPVKMLSVHKPAGQAIIWREGRENEAAQRAYKQDRNSMFVGYMQLCAREPEARDYTFQEIPERYVWHKDAKDSDGKLGVWRKEARDRRRKGAGGPIGDLRIVYSSDVELFAIRLLALHRKGYISFAALKTIVDGEPPCDTFTEAARRLGLLNDIEIWRRTMIEANQLSPWNFVRFFGQLVLNSCQSYARELFDEFMQEMVGQCGEGEYDAKLQGVLRHLARIFAQVNKKCFDFNLPEPENFEADNLEEFYFPSHEGDDPTWSTVRKNLTLGERMYREMNEEQKTVIDIIEGSVENVRDNPLSADFNRMFFLDAPGGTGKTFTAKTLIYRARESRDGDRRHVLTSATTGIAASLLPSGMTTHSAFRLPVGSKKADATIRWQSFHGSRIRAAEVIIIDEVSMLSTKLMKQIDQICRDLEEMPAKKRLPFGGKVVLLSGDWKQLLPVLPGKSIFDQAQASFRCSDLFKEFVTLRLTINMRLEKGAEWYAQFVEDVGYGRNFALNPDGTQSDRVFLPEEFSRPTSTAILHDETKLIDAVFPTAVLNHPEQAASNAILAPHNNRVTALNDLVLDRLIGETRTYLSIDSAENGNPLDIHYEADRLPENLHQVNSGSLPLHELKLKKGAVVMLMRNLDVASGLCNGTRMVIDELGEDIVWCRVLQNDGKLSAQRQAIARFNFSYDDSDEGQDKTGLQFSRTQFPLKLAYSLTINKAQGQTIAGKLGIDLRHEVFCPGALYVALTRTRNPTNVYFLLNRVVGSRPSVRNIVWNFDNPIRQRERSPVNFETTEIAESNDEEGIDEEMLMEFGDVVCENSEWIPEGHTRPVAELEQLSDAEGDELMEQQFETNNFGIMPFIGTLNDDSLNLEVEQYLNRLDEEMEGTEE